MQACDDADEMVARLQAATSRPGGGVTWDRVRSVVFRMLHLMAQKRDNKGPSKRQNATSAFLLAFDGIQVVSVLSSPEFGYAFDGFGWLNALSISRALSIRVIGLTWAMALWVFSSCVLALAVANAMLVAWQVGSGGHSGSLWPMRTLRAFVSVVLTALYVPLVQSASRFISCENMTNGALAAGDEPIVCWGITHAILFGASILVLALFVPFAIMVRAIYFDDTPTGGSIVAKPLARADMLDTFCRTTIVFGGLFINDSNRMAILVVVTLLYTWLLTVTIHHLPFYKRSMTMIRVGQVFLYAELAACAVALEVAKNNDAEFATRLTIAQGALIGMPAAVAIGALLAWRRLRRMRTVAIAAAESAIRAAIKKASADSGAEDGRSDARGGDDQPSVIALGTARLASARKEAGADADPSSRLAQSMPMLDGALAERPAHQPARYLLSSGRASGGRDREDASETDDGESTGRPNAQTVLGGLLQGLPEEPTAEGEDDDDDDSEALFSADGKADSGPAGQSAGGKPGNSSITPFALPMRDSATINSPVAAASRPIEPPSATGTKPQSFALPGPATGGKAATAPNARRGSMPATTGAGHFSRTVAGTSTRASTTALLTASLGRSTGTGPTGRSAKPRDGVVATKDKPGGKTGFLDAVKSSMGSRVSTTILMPLKKPRAPRRPKRKPRDTSSRAGDLDSSRGNTVSSSRPRGTEEGSDGDGAPHPSRANPKARRMAEQNKHSLPTGSPSRTSPHTGPAPADPALEISLGGTMKVDAQRLLDTPIDPARSRHTASDTRRRVSSGSAGGMPGLSDFLDKELFTAPQHGSLAAHARSFLASETDVEVMVRSLLRDSTPRRVFYAKALLEDALTVFPDSVYIRIVYATFLFNWASEEETFRAVSLLVEAARLPASLDLQYALFARITTVLELRRKLQIGTTGADVDSIGLIEFRKEFREAERKHLLAIKGLSSWWGAVAAAETDGIAMREGTVSERLESIATDCHDAERIYLKLKDRYPQAKALARAYGIFLINARVDELGTTYTRAGEDVDEAVGGRRASGFGGMFGSEAASQSGMSGSGPSGTGSGTSGTEVTRRRQQRLQERLAVELPIVKSTTRGFRMALVGLVMALVGIFVSTSIVFDTLRLSVETMDAAGLRRKLTESAWYAARGMQLSALEGDAAGFAKLQAHMLTEMQTLGKKHSFLFYEGRRFPTIDSLWGSTDTVSLREFNPDVPQSRRHWNSSASLWVAGNLFIATASRLARLNISEFGAASTVPEWRFVMDNAPNSLLNAFETAVRLYQNEDRTLILQQTMVQGSLLAVKVIILTLLAGLVFWPALRSVHSGKSNIRRLVMSLPKRLGKHMHRRYKKIERILTELEQAGMTLEDVDPTSQRYQVLKETNFLLRIQTHGKSLPIQVVGEEKDEADMAGTGLAIEDGDAASSAQAYAKDAKAPFKRKDPTSSGRSAGTAMGTYRSQPESMDGGETSDPSRSNRSESRGGAGRPSKGLAAAGRRGRPTPASPKHPPRRAPPRPSLDSRKSGSTQGHALTDGIKSSPALPARKSLKTDMADSKRVFAAGDPSLGADGASIGAGGSGTGAGSGAGGGAKSPHAGLHVPPRGSPVAPAGTAKLPRQMEVGDEEEPEEGGPGSGTPSDMSMNSGAGSGSGSGSGSGGRRAGRCATGDDGDVEEEDDLLGGKRPRGHGRGRGCKPSPGAGTRGLANQQQDLPLASAPEGRRQSAIEREAAEASDAALLITDGDVLLAVTDAEELSSLMRQRQSAVSRGVPRQQAMRSGLGIDGVTAMGVTAGSVDSAGAADDDEEDDDTDVGALLIADDRAGKRDGRVTSKRRKRPSSPHPGFGKKKRPSSPHPGRATLPKGSDSPDDPSSGASTPQVDGSVDGGAGSDSEAEHSTGDGADVDDALVTQDDSVADSRSASSGSAQDDDAAADDDDGGAGGGGRRSHQHTGFKTGAFTGTKAGYGKETGNTGGPPLVLPPRDDGSRAGSTHGPHEPSPHATPPSPILKSSVRRNSSGMRHSQESGSLAPLLTGSKLGSGAESSTVKVVTIQPKPEIEPIVNFFLTINISESGSTKPAELNNAGRRRYLARETLNTARELLINDNEIGTVAELSTRLFDYVEFYKQVHDGLRHGSEELGLPGAERRHQSLEDLMYAQDTTGFVASNTASLREPGATVPADALAAYGLDPLFRLYTTTITELLQQFSNQTALRPGLSQSRLLATPKFKLAFELEKGPLGSGFGTAVKLYKEEGLHEVTTLETLQNSLVGVELLLVLLVYAVVHRIVRQALRKEHLRAVDVQSLVPPTIAGTSPRLAAWRHAVRHHAKALVPAQHQ